MMTAWGDFTPGSFVPCVRRRDVLQWLRLEGDLSHTIHHDVHSGMWRSLVARYLGEVEVTGSNPVIPTTNQRDIRWFSLFFSLFW